MEHWLTIASSLVVALVCIGGVFSDFKDTAAQRVALGVGCISATGIAWHCWNDGELPGTVQLFLWALAVHCIEAARKFRKMTNEPTSSPAA